jgi:hypothetical protein
MTTDSGSEFAGGNIDIPQFLIANGDTAYCCEGDFDGISIFALPMFSSREDAIAFMRRHDLGAEWRLSRPATMELVTTLRDLRHSGVAFVQLERATGKSAEAVGISRVIKALQSQDPN